MMTSSRPLCSSIRLRRNLSLADKPVALLVFIEVSLSDEMWLMTLFCWYPVYIIVFYKYIFREAIWSNLVYMKENILIPTVLIIRGWWYLWLAEMTPQGNFSVINAEELMTFRLSNKLLLWWLMIYDHCLFCVWSEASGKSHCSVVQCEAIW